jgi:dihydroorotate dehydrogenase
MGEAPAEMSIDPYRLVRAALFRADPEVAHNLAISALKLGVYPRPTRPDPPILGQSLMGLDFANPLGMAAGFDKNAEVPGPLLAMGFGFAEVGTVTPRPQPGNPRPRMFRLVEDEALINRLGFNSEGQERARDRLAARRRNGVVGVNIGANRESADRIGDYVAGVRAFAGLADYLTVNISSPNTPGLRDLQEEGALGALLTGVVEALAAGPEPRPPLLVKIAPDLDDAALAAIVETCVARGIDGLIVANTTLSRAGLTNAALAAEAGGLSGRPLFALATRVLARAHLDARGRLVLIGVGGVASGGDAYTKIRAGASLVQLYTAMVFEGPGIVARIKTELAALLEREGHNSIAEAVGTGADGLKDLGL